MPRFCRPSQRAAGAGWLTKGRRPARAFSESAGRGRPPAAARAAAGRARREDAECVDQCSQDGAERERGLRGALRPHPGLPDQDCADHDPHVEHEQGRRKAGHPPTPPPRRPRAGARGHELPVARILSSSPPPPPLLAYSMSMPGSLVQTRCLVLDPAALFLSFLFFSAMPALPLLLRTGSGAGAATPRIGDPRPGCARAGIRTQGRMPPSCADYMR